MLILAMKTSWRTSEGITKEERISTCPLDAADMFHHASFPGESFISDRPLAPYRPHFYSSLGNKSPCITQDILGAKSRP